jgi:hypothetical protein
MARKIKTKLIKKTVVIPEVIDKAIRTTWSMLIERGYDASFSSAMNMMLLSAIIQAKDGFTDEALETAWDFIEDQSTLNAIKIEESLAVIREHYLKMDR